ncbi:phage holin family protein [Saccharibacillus kuerlensis]|uniref:Toxin secretion/phage lysis holin n=1 Tax=Saccharibacillus kuerlensis TaxID=459527 RepID=A0ABQ2L0U3_9BACL|nr:phage holin family protein [Saccharibacillus kuerlensis]GGN99000.1 hypothetical protein GCM10010969_18780 [Saccharibacillus kuerlensis]
MLIGLLLVMASVDWAAEGAAAWVRGKLRTRICFVGLMRKVAIFAVVAIAHMIDEVLGDLHIFRDAVVFFYLANELLSIIGNMSKIGVPMPEILHSIVRIFQSKSYPIEGWTEILDAKQELTDNQKSDKNDQADKWDEETNKTDQIKEVTKRPSSNRCAKVSEPRKENPNNVSE